MYLVIIIALMGVLPILSVVVELVAVAAADPVTLVGKWFVFWAVGVRLFLAGVKQTTDPGFTARSIFQIADRDAEKVVVELGFANLSIGLLGLLTIFEPGWIVPAALAGGLFYALAGIQHVRNAKRTTKEVIAMVSDLAIAVVLAVFLALTLL